MKKYLFTFISALIVGFFLCNIFLKQYGNLNIIKASSSGEELYFIQYGVFSSLESLEKNTINLQSYIYNEQDGLYYVYVGITGKKEIADKIVKHYKNLGNDTLIKKFGVTNKKFLDILDNYDQVLENTNDDIAISSIINQVLSKYEEVVISGSQN